MEADLQKVLPIRQLQIGLLELPGNTGDLIQRRVAYGHEPQCLKIGRFGRPSAEFTENKHPGKIFHAGSCGQQHGRFFLIESVQSLKTGTFVLEPPGQIMEGDGATFAELFEFFLFAVDYALDHAAGTFGESLQGSEFLLHRGTLSIIGAPTVLQSDVVQKTAYAGKLGKKLHPHGRTGCSLSAVIEREHFPSTAGMLHGIRTIRSEVQKHWSDGILQIRRTDEVVIIEILPAL